MKYKLYVHPTCSSSYRVVKYLLRKDLLENIKIVNTTHAIAEVLKYSVLSVPALAINGKVIAVDPLEPEFVEKVILGDDISEYVPYDISSAYLRVLSSIKSSFYILLYILVYNNIEFLVNTGFLYAASRIHFTKSLELNSLLDIIKQRENKLYEELWSKGSKIIAYNYIRELYWLNIDLYSYSYTVDNIALWLIAKLSIGRSGIPSSIFIGKIKELALRALNVLLSSKQRLIYNIINEQHIIENDSEYMELLKYRTS